MINFIMQMEKKKKRTKEDFIGFKTNKENREKALAFVSPDTSKMIGYQLDKVTTIYFKSTVPEEKRLERLKLYKKQRELWD